MNTILKLTCVVLLLIISTACSTPKKQFLIQDVEGMHSVASDKIWLTHEHILVDFIGADSIQPNTWSHDSVLKSILPYFEKLKAFKINYFVDATPNYIGRDVLLLHKIAQKTGIRILTNTGLYGARNNKFIPQYAFKKSASELAEMWINEFEAGINNTSIKPGFIKIGIDNSDTLHTLHQKLVKAAALTHSQTGLTIVSHTGPANGLWPQLSLLKKMGVSPEAFIWSHANWEASNENLLKAAKEGCWISLDGLAWELEDHIDKLLFAKENGFLDKILISHDAGWYDPQKEKQSIKPYTSIFTQLYPALKSKGFTDKEFNLLICKNPAKAFAIGVKSF